VPDYALIQGVFIGCVSAYVIVLALIGPENHGSHFENSKPAFEAGASKEDVGSSTREHEIRDLDQSSIGSEGKEKGEIQLVETKRPRGASYAV
jgi:SHS family lactate transporter-like MFS transporter